MKKLAKCDKRTQNPSHVVYGFVLFHPTINLFQKIHFTDSKFLFSSQGYTPKIMIIIIVTSAKTE